MRIDLKELNWWITGFPPHFHYLALPAPSASASLSISSLKCEKVSRRRRLSLSLFSDSSIPQPHPSPLLRYLSAAQASLSSDNSKMQSCESLSRAQIRMDGKTHARTLKRLDYD